MTEVQMHTREFHVREFNEETREFVGIAVPWDKPAQIRDWFGSYTETFERGSVEIPASGKVLLYWRHEEPIGLIFRHEDTDEGWEIHGRISKTSRGDEAHQLLRDGVVDELSIGFNPIEHREDDKTGNITRTRVLGREVSLVPMGAYGANAKVSAVREENTNAHERSTPMETTITPEDLAEVRAEMGELSRSFTAFTQRQEVETEPADTRSAAEFVKALVAGDADTLREANEIQAIAQRAYTGATTADSVVKDGWVGDLTRLYDGSTGVLQQIFGTGTLPAEGMNIEYGQLKSNTIVVAEQAAEGDDLTFGKVQLETKTAPVKTFGGYTQLTFQEIQRSSLPIVQRSLEALTIAAAAAHKTALRSAFGTLVTARTAIAANAGVVLLGATLGASTYSNFVNALVDAAIKYDALNLELEALVASASVFKKLAGLAGTDGRPMMSLDGSGANTVGTLNVKALQGQLVGVPVYLDAGQAGDALNAVNGKAITAYTSPVVSLQDTNIINLSQDFSVYRYAAFAAEIPAAVVPVKLAAS